MTGLGKENTINAHDQLQMRAMAYDQPRLLIPQKMNIENQSDLIEGTVRQIQKWGLAGIASAILDSCRPITFIGGQLLWMVQPIFGIFTDYNKIGGIAQLLEQPDAVELLRSRLEEC